jgi:hypothetical protein
LIDFLKPTPMGTVLELRGKFVLGVTGYAEGEIRAKGEVVMTQIPESNTR